MVIKNGDRIHYRFRGLSQPEFNDVISFENEFFPHDLRCSPELLKEWHHSCSYFFSTAYEGRKIIGSASVLLTNIEQIELLLEGKILEPELKPLSRCTDLPVFYFASFIAISHEVKVGLSESIMKPLCRQIATWSYCPQLIFGIGCTRAGIGYLERAKYYRLTTKRYRGRYQFYANYVCNAGSCSMFGGLSFEN